MTPSASHLQDQYGLGGTDPYAFTGASQAQSQAPSQGGFGGGSGAGYSSQLPRFEGLTPSQDGGAPSYGDADASQGFRG